MDEVHDIREAMASAIKAKLPAGAGVVLEVQAGATGRVVVVELPDSVPLWPQMAPNQKVYFQPVMSVAVIITPPWDSEGGRRLVNDVIGAMSAVAEMNCVLAPEGATRGTYETGSGQSLPCYRFTAQYPKPIEG